MNIQATVCNRQKKESAPGVSERTEINITDQSYFTIFLEMNSLDHKQDIMSRKSAKNHISMPNIFSATMC